MRVIIKITFIAFIAFIPIRMKAQHIEKIQNAEELLIINGSSATVFEWFKKLESNGISLSYNASKIDLNKQVTLSTQRTSVEKILELLLSQYEFNLHRTSENKILIQITGEKRVQLHGKIQDKETGESLYGYVVSLKDSKGKSYFSLANSNGFFSFKLPIGTYSLMTSYIGYYPHQENLTVTSDCFTTIKMKPQTLSIDEVTITPSIYNQATDSQSPINLLSVSNSNPFAFLGTLPGILGSSVQGDLHVNGGDSDENQILLDGIPLYHSRHNNSLLSQINGDAVSNISFFDSFIPAQYEGRLSSVTDVKLKQGNIHAHHQQLAIDMPAAAATFEGPIYKNKVSYMLSARHSWLDFMQNLLSDSKQTDRSFYDVTAKVSYQISPQTSVNGLIYHSQDSYNDTIQGSQKENILQWDNNLYALSLNTIFANKITNTSILSFTTHQNEVYAPILGIDLPMYIHEGMNRINLKSDYRINLDEYTALSWGIGLSHEKFNLLAEKDSIQNERQRVTQLSTYANVKLRISERLLGNVALNMVTYLPFNNPSHVSLQPRFTLRYFSDRRNIFSIDFSRMGQFYHNVGFGETPIPTDLRMPSIKGFKPRSAVHVEAGWQHAHTQWRYKISTYYKRRYHVLGIRYNILPEEEEWNQFIMAGNALSYGIKLHGVGSWNRWKINASYTYARSKEWFADYDNGKKHPALHDIPHNFTMSTSYRIKQNSFLTLGGYIKSGSWVNVFNEDIFSTEFISGRKRSSCNYRMDLSFASHREFSNTRLKLNYKLGLYNLIGNPKYYELLDLYSIETNKHCLPYFTLSLAF